MRDSQAEIASRLVREREAIKARREAEVNAAVRDLIERHVGPDNRIADMPSFRAALAEAMRAARWQGETDRSRKDVLSLM